MSRSPWCRKPASMRRTSSLAVPEGRSRFERRCHSRTYGSNPSTSPNSADARSTSRKNTAAPRLRFGAATAAASWARRSASTRSRCDSQPVVAMTIRRQPASRTAATLSRTASGRDASIIRPGAPRRAGSCCPSRGRPSSRASVPRSPKASAIVCPSGPSPKMIVSIAVPLSCVTCSTRAPVRRQRKSRGHRCGVRGPWSLRSRRLVSVVVYARRQSPRTRASRQGRKSFSLASVVMG